MRGKGKGYAQLAQIKNLTSLLKKTKRKKCTGSYICHKASIRMAHMHNCDVHHRRRKGGGGGGGGGEAGGGQAPPLII